MLLCLSLSPSPLFLGLASEKWQCSNTVCWIITNSFYAADWLRQNYYGNVKAWWQITGWLRMFFPGNFWFLWSMPKVSNVLIMIVNYIILSVVFYFISLFNYIYVFQIQCALLYTTVYGQRRIRVTTLSLPCTSMLSNLFRAADLDTQFSCYMKQGIKYAIFH